MKKKTITSETQGTNKKEGLQCNFSYYEKENLQQRS